jgi:hypothetical protein
MEDTTKLWFYIAGELDLFPVSVTPDETIAKLKQKIHAASPDSFPGRGPAQLVLTKVRYIMTSMNTDVINGLCWPITLAGR